MNKTLSEKLVYLRDKYNLSQREMAKLAGIAQSSYQGLEKGHQSEQSGNGKKVYQRIVLKPWRLKEVAEKKARKRDVYRIPNIPNFYKDLDALCDKDGRLIAESGDEDLVALQKKLGVVVPTNPSGRRPIKRAIKEQEALGKLFEEYRGDLSGRVFAKMIGVKSPTYWSIESGRVSSKSSVMQRLLTHDIYTKEQQEKLQVAYVQLKEAEK